MIKYATGSSSRAFTTSAIKFLNISFKLLSCAYLSDAARSIPLPPCSSPFNIDTRHALISVGLDNNNPYFYFKYGRKKVYVRTLYLKQIFV